jgi:hypothetical protein
MTHPDGARRLAGPTAVVGDPTAAATAYARLFAQGVVFELDGGAEVRTGDAPITFLTPAALVHTDPGLARPAAAYSALRLAVVDLDAARGLLVDAGVTACATADGIAVAPAEAAGAIVEFVPA